MHFCMDEVRVLLAAGAILPAAWLTIRHGYHRVRDFWRRRKA